MCEQRLIRLPESPDQDGDTLEPLLRQGWLLAAVVRHRDGVYDAFLLRWPERPQADHPERPRLAARRPRR